MSTTSFKERVFRVVRQIPKGDVLTYAEVARRAGSPRAYRAVGTILKGNYDPGIFCHRVIKSSGELGEYNRGATAKRALLLQEGFILGRQRGKGTLPPRKKQAGTKDSR